MRYAISYWATRALISGSPRSSACDPLQFGQLVEHLAPAGGRPAGGFFQVEHRVAAAAELHALVDAREEPVAPQPAVERLVDPVLGDQHDERRQVLVGGPEPVAEPRPHRRPAGELVPGLEERDGRVVVDVLRVHRPHKAQVVGHPGRVRQQLAHPRAGLAVPGELERRPGQRQGGLVAGHAGEPLAHADGGGEVLAVHLVQQRLVVEQVQLRRPAGHEQVDDPLGPRRQVRPAEDACGGEGTKRAQRLRRWHGRGSSPGGRRRPVHQPRERDPAEPEAEPAEEVAAVHRVVDVVVEHRSPLGRGAEEIEPQRHRGCVNGAAGIGRSDRSQSTRSYSIPQFGDAGPAADRPPLIPCGLRSPLPCTQGRGLG